MTSPPQGVVTQPALYRLLNIPLDIYGAQGRVDTLYAEKVSGAKYLSPTEAYNREEEMCVLQMQHI